MKNNNNTIYRTEQNRTEQNRTMLTPRSSFIAGCLLLASLLTPALLQASDNNKLPDANLPDLGTSAANTATVQPNINAQGAGFNYRDNINGKLISISPQYSKQTGAAIDGSFATPIAKNMAFGILLTAGADKNEWLINAGVDLTSNQRLVFSLGQLRQRLDFNFVSGTEKAKITQDNLAASYQYLLGKDWLNAAEVNGYISDAGSVTLGDKAYRNDTFLDPRRIAGGRVTGVQGKLVFTPTSKTTLKVGLGAERLIYDYLTGNESTTRATGSAELMQRLDNDFNFRASANAASSQNRYALGLGRTFKGGSQLGIDIATIQGRDNTFNDNQLLLSYTQSFGGTNASALGRNAFNTNNLALNELDASGAPTNQPNTNTATPNQTNKTWTSTLVEQVSRRPSFIPAQVIAKIDHTALPKTLLPAGAVVSGGLTWTRNNSTVAFPGYANWTNANATCAALTAQGLVAGSWRLPTSAELSALYAAGTGPLSTAGWTLYYTWSATTAGAGIHYFVGLDYGGVSISLDSYNIYVSCVH